MKKKSFMKKAAATAMLTAIVSTWAYADTTYTISTGREGGSYFTVLGPQVIKFLRGAGLTNTTFTPSTGSLENLKRVAAGNDAQIGFTQADALMYFRKTNPVEGIKIEIGAPLVKECLFVAVKKDGPINDVDDLKKKGVTVAAGAEGDGSRATWDYMSVLDEKFKLATTVDFGGALGLSQLSSGQANAFLFVTNPDTLASSEIFNLVSSNKNLKFVNANSWNLNDKLPNGDAIYTKETVVTKKGIFNDTVKTICTQSYVVYNANVPVTDKEKLAKAFLRMSAANSK